MGPSVSASEEEKKQKERPAGCGLLAEQKWAAGLLAVAAASLARATGRDWAALCSPGEQ